MDLINEVRALRKQLTCLLDRSGITILRIGNKTVDNSKHNTLQVRNNGDRYLVDRNGEVEKLNDYNSTGTNKKVPIEVQIGSAEAIALGFLAGDTTLEDIDFKNEYLEILIGNIPLYGIDKGDDSPWFEKPLADTVAVLHGIILFDGNVVKIKYI